MPIIAIQTKNCAAKYKKLDFALLLIGLVFAII